MFLSFKKLYPYVPLAVKENIMYSFLGLDDEESNPALAELKEENDSRVQIEFGALVVYACKKLEESVSPDDFRTFTITIFPSCPIENLSNVREMFNAIIKHRRWSYQEHRQLRNILRNWKIADPETKAKFSNYSQLLHSYNVTTKIVDWIKKKKLDKRHLDRKSVV